MRGNKTVKSDKRISMAQKRARVVELRSEGKTFQQIADVLTVEFKRSYSRQSIHELFVSAVAAIPALAVEEHRQSVIDRTEKIYSELAIISTSGAEETRDRISAYKTLLSAQDQMIRVLGLNAPEKQDLTVTPGNSKGEEIHQKLLDIVARRKENGEP